MPGASGWYRPRAGQGAGSGSAGGGAAEAPWRDARVWGAMAAAAYYFWRRHDSSVLPLSIAAGMAVYLPLRLVWNW